MANYKTLNMDYSIEKYKKYADNEKLVVQKNNDASINKINALLKEHIAEIFKDELRTSDVKQGSKLEKDIYEEIINFLKEKDVIFRPNSLKIDIVKGFMVSLSGYGILQPLMDDDTIEEIYVYAPDKIWYLKGGKKTLSNIKFESSEKLKAFIDNVLGRINRTVNVRNPIEDGRLPDGSRIAVSADVLSPNGYTMNIRKFRKKGITLDELVAYNTLDEWTKNLLIAIIKSHLNFLVSGGTSSGKTTLLNAMSLYIPQDENVETVEDNIELQLDREYWLQLETRKENIEGGGEVTMENLLVHLLRRSPDRIIVGEIRTAEVADTFLNAIQTGHDGTCATIHANTPKRCQARVAKLASIASNQPYEAALNDFNNSINVIIQLKKHELLKKRIITNIDYVNNDGTLVSLMHFDNKERVFKHCTKLPEKLQDVFDEYNVKI